MADRSLLLRIEYIAVRFVFRVLFVPFFRYRCQGREKLPPDGAVLVCANHQSFLDPPLVGVAFNRRLNYLARKTLFRFRPFGRFIASLDAIPLEKDGMGMAGLKESLRRLKRGESIVIFPEGTRSTDGEVAALKPGFCVLARRSAVTVLPVGIDGAYAAWPRSKRLPRPRGVQLVVGDPISPDCVERMDDAALTAEVERRIRACHGQARALRARR